MSKTLTFKEILDKTNATKRHTIEIPDLAGSIIYEDLTFEEFADLYNKRKETDPIGFSKSVLTKAWQKADPTVTEDGVKILPARIIVSLANRIVPDILKLSPLGPSPALKSDALST